MSASKTYLDLVNAVLVRLREDTVPSVNGSDDVVVELVKEFVNDAKRTVEDSHTWSSLAHEWTVTMDGALSATGTLDGSFGSIIVDYVLDDEGREIRPMLLKDMNKVLLRGNGSAGVPNHYAIAGRVTAGKLLRTKIKFDALVDNTTGRTYTVYGYQPQADLTNDTDIMLVPSKPVIYMAEAMAARERGEVGAQSAGELLAMAKGYIGDAIAMDATNSDLDNIWTSV